MEFEEIKKTAVVGVGTMGAQIAEVLARIGKYTVNISDTNPQLVENGLKTIEETLDKFYVSKGKITPEGKEIVLGRIRKFENLEKAVEDVDFVIEAVFENVNLKKDIFQKLDNYILKHTILASNTSLQNITEISSSTKRPGMVVGMHFFNPVAVMKLVEVVKGAHTSDETLKITCALARKLGKEPIVCRDTSYGFLANRAYNALLNEAVQMVWERVAPPTEIDKALKLGYNFPMGPLENFDYTGAWAHTVSSEQDAIRELGPEKGRVHSLIRMMVRAGYTGGQGKKGMYAFWDEVLSKW